MKMTTTVDIKFTKFDNRPWGFRLAGGSDFPQPLTVIRVSEESLAECMGLQVGDIVIRLNDQPVYEMTHGQAHEALCLAGNNFVLTVRRAEDPKKLIEGIQGEKIEPYMLPLEEILLKERETTPDEVPQIQDECVPYVIQETECVEVTVEEYPEKPRDENSEVIPNKHLSEDEIAQLILEEEEVLNDKGVLGVNFNKIRPRVPLLKESKVLQELQKETDLISDKPGELNLKSTFLKKPDRPVPSIKSNSPDKSQESSEQYRVVIKKQPKKSVTERLLEKGLIDAGKIKTPEPVSSEQATPSATPEPRAVSETPKQEESRPESTCDNHESNLEATSDKKSSETPVPPTLPESENKEITIKEESNSNNNEIDVEVTINMDRDKIRELVSTEINLEKQLESVQQQLLALKQLPSEIEKHLKVVSDQLHKIMELSGVEVDNNDGGAKDRAEKVAEILEAEERRQHSHQEYEQQKYEYEVNEVEKNNNNNFSDDGRRSAASQSSGIPQVIEPSDDETESRELEISVKSNESDGRKVKKFFVSYESKVIEESMNGLRSREPSPASSEDYDDVFEVDPTLPLQEQLIKEMEHRKGKKRSHELWQPQAKQLELTYGRRWRCPNDFFNDDMIAEVLSSQAEVIRGRAMGVNFKKFEKTALPNFDHLMNSSVYKMIHKMDTEPKKGIPARPPKVNAAEDIIERVNTPCNVMADDRSVRSISH